MFKSTRNKVITIINESKQNKSRTLNLSDLGLTEIPMEVSKLTHIETINLNNNKIKTLQNLPQNLISLSASNNVIDSLEGIPSSIVMLCLDNNNLNCISLKPFSSLMCISCHHNRIRLVEDISDTLNIALFGNNSFEVLPNFKNVSTLNVSYNHLDEFTFPKNAVEVDVSGNNLTSLMNFPPSLMRLTCLDLKLSGPDKIDARSMLIDTIGLNANIVKNYMNHYSSKIQALVRRFLVRQQIPYKKLMKHINDVGQMPKNMNYWALKAYYKNPLCKLAYNGGLKIEDRKNMHLVNEDTKNKLKLKFR